DDAEALFDHALALDSNNPDAWAELAALFSARGEFERAAECFECAASVLPSDTAIANNLARSRGHIGDVVGAMAALERLLPFGIPAGTIRSPYCCLATRAQRRAGAPTQSRRPPPASGTYPVGAAPPDSTAAGS